MGLIIDNFAGGGGASEGIEQAMGRHVDVAINHDPGAIAMHKANHPHTKHYCENVWDVDPNEVCKGQPVDLAWFSPDCTHFSKAKGGKPRDKNIRGLAWVAVKWAMQVRPAVIILENVEEFKTWGPLGEDNQPDKNKTGETFNSFVEQLKIIGYHVEFRELVAADYGAPTRRKRFFMVARCDGLPILWPKKSHGPRKSIEVLSGKLKPYTPVADVMDFSKPCPSIFDTKEEIMEKHGLRTVRPLADKTMERIARGIEKFIINNPDPFFIKDQTSMLIQYHSETLDHEVRGQAIDEPIMTIDSSPRYGLISSHIIQMNNHMIGTDSRDPVNTIVAGPGHLGEVRAFLIKYYGQGIGQDLKEPIGTIVSKDRFGLIIVKGVEYQIVDIGMRMLEPRELFTANGFPPAYIIDHDADGKKITKTEQVKRCGNAVPPVFAKELVLANVVGVERTMAS
ncbi:DNA cytosine methyltransferase [Acetobacterium paludosum]|uniref:DNA (cytosine-5-)-methyltransferase n=1 Tax=Acetobacterium paludosum TaxID=52693 RepID=A0A923I5Q7_9FIRM|nr:DNA cytosine methyltransferase [Acetobacterium paludosum]MBC3889485.1 DNA cytosine methyltransferase [Acetobacterium paludosum]